MKYEVWSIWSMKYEIKFTIPCNMDTIAVIVAVIVVIIVASLLFRRSKDITVLITMLMLPICLKSRTPLNPLPSQGELFWGACMQKRANLMDRSSGNQCWYTMIVLSVLRLSLPRIVECAASRPRRAAWQEITRASLITLSGGRRVVPADQSVVEKKSGEAEKKANVALFSSVHFFTTLLSF